MVYVSTHVLCACVYIYIYMHTMEHLIDTFKEMGQIYIYQPKEKIYAQNVMGNGKKKE